MRLDGFLERMGVRVDLVFLLWWRHDADAELHLLMQLRLFQAHQLGMEPTLGLAGRLVGSNGLPLDMFPSSSKCD